MGLKCPKCGSESVTLWMGGRLGMVYFCKSCGYRGPLVMEEDEAPRKGSATRAGKKKG